MLEEKIISLEELSKFGSTVNLNAQAHSLITQQEAIWETAAQNYAALNRIQTRKFNFDHFKIFVQINPERIRSTAAKTDAHSIAARPCFLCLENLPGKQKGIVFQNKYLILTNPYPIFPKHLTISKIEHTPQNIFSHFFDLLELSENLPEFTVFYNGPKCGASAPDHFHFQGGNAGFLPIEKDFESLERYYSEILFQNENSKIIAVQNYFRRFVAIVSSEKKFILKKFDIIYHQLESNKIEEPMMNILCNFIENKWRVIIFPREKQRPSHFYRNGEKQIISSPAAVELGGLFILPREDDFKKITSKEIKEIYGEVTIQPDKFEKLIDGLRKLEN